MFNSSLQPKEQRRFALDVVRRLRKAGYEAYWAGGCVRDRLLDRTPKDYDVATNATPEQVRELFGRRRTLALGAAFGVIAVVGPKAAGVVEVTTFRRDAEYSDGRRPDRVAFSSPEEDAARRDFTINGLFYDPIDERVIDFVGGQKDLAAHCVRAIGNPRERFAEDKLRLLRAVRFAAAYAFTLDEETEESVAQMASEIHVVSPERIAMEMRRLLTDSHRADGVWLLMETGLARELLPEIICDDPRNEIQRRRLDEALATLSRLAVQPSCHGAQSPSAGKEVQCSSVGLGGSGSLDTGGGRATLDSAPGFPLALAALLAPWVDATGAEAVCRRWRLSNKETDRVVWLVEHYRSLDNARTMRWSALQPLLIAEGIDDLLALCEARAPAGVEETAYCRMLLKKSRDALDPPPFVTGDDLAALGIPPGPEYRTLLDRLRAAQLDGEIHSKTEALALADRWRGQK